MNSAPTVVRDAAPGAHSRIRRVAAANPGEHVRHPHGFLPAPHSHLWPS